MNITEKEAGKVLYALRQAQIEFISLKLILPNSYQASVQGVADICKEGMKIMHNVVSQSEGENERTT